MSTKPTPGPWKVDRSENLSAEWDCADDSATTSTWQPITDVDGRAIALVVDSSSEYTERTSFDADARLIAAAPELLEALQHIKQHAVLDRIEVGIVDAAIAKATGGEA